MNHDKDIREAPGLLVEALRHFSKLMQDEVRLARAEISRNLSRAGMGLAFIGIATILALVGLNVLASALVAWIAAEGLSVGLAALIVGGILLLVAIILALAGKSRLSADALTPSRSTDNLKKDAARIKESTHA